MDPNATTASPSSHRELSPALPTPESAAAASLDASAAPLPGVTRWIGAHRVDLDECGSTNDEAGRLARAGARHGTVVTSRTQSQGRGRAGRTWTSPAGNLYVSLVLRPALQLRDVPAMTLAIGVAVCETVRAFGVDAALKWPNDVLVGARKLAGILLESQSRGERLDVVIAGIGINLETPPEPQSAPLACCLSQERGAPVDREAFLAVLLANIECWIDRYVACGLTKVLPVWQSLMDRSTRARTRLGSSDAEGTVERTIEGTIEGLDDSGALLLRDDAGALHRVTAGDVETVRSFTASALPPVLHPKA